MNWVKEARFGLVSTIEKIEDVLMFDLEKFRECTFWAGDAKDEEDEENENLSDSTNNTKS